MFSYRDARALAVAMALWGAGTAMADDGEGFGFGTPASDAEIAGWNIDVGPDGEGLPAGRGTALQGEELYLAKCAACHGEFGEGVGRYAPVAGGVGSITTDSPERTAGSYWPYATTLWDYIYRTMPFGDAQSLSADQVYALTAYILSLSDIVDETTVLDAGSLAQVRMPNRNGFVFPDPRPDTDNIPCMRACKVGVSISSRASQSPLNASVTQGASTAP
jgi:cytochrome c